MCYYTFCLCYKQMYALTIKFLSCISAMKKLRQVNLDDYFILVLSIKSYK